MHSLCRHIILEPEQANRLDLQEGMKFTYTYDFGDDWVHDIKVEKILPPTRQAPTRSASRANAPARRRIVAASGAMLRSSKFSPWWPGGRFRLLAGTRTKTRKSWLERRAMISVLSFWSGWGRNLIPRLLIWTPSMRR